jgi:hypothetical protein
MGSRTNDEAKKAVADADFIFATANGDDSGQG